MKKNKFRDKAKLKWKFSGSKPLPPCYECPNAEFNKKGIKECPTVGKCMELTNWHNDYKRLLNG